MTNAHELLLIGEDFEPGAVVNTEIDTMLGFDAVMCGEFAIRLSDGYTHSPNYCQDYERTVAELEKLNVYPVIVPASHHKVKKRAQRSQETSKGLSSLYVAIFTIGDEIRATRPFKTEENALACVLWYTLAYYH